MVRRTVNSIPARDFIEELLCALIVNGALRQCPALQSACLALRPEDPSLNPASQPLWRRQRRLQQVGKIPRSVNLLKP